MNFLFLALAALAFSCTKAKEDPSPAPSPTYKNEFELIGSLQSGGGKYFPGSWASADILSAVSPGDWSVVGEVSTDSPSGTQTTFVLKTNLGDGETVRVARACPVMTAADAGVLPDSQNGALKDFAFAFSDAVSLNESWATKFTLYQPMSYLCVSLTAAAGSSYAGSAVEYVRFSCPGAALAGDFTIDLQNHTVTAGSSTKSAVTVTPSSQVILGTEEQQLWMTILPASMNAKKCTLEVNGAKFVFDGRDILPSCAYKLSVGPLGGAVISKDTSKEEFTRTPVEYKSSAEISSWSTAGAVNTIAVDGMNWMDRLTGYTLDKWGGYKGVTPDRITSSNPAGFWRTGIYKGHHVMVDPDGNVAIAHGVNGVTPDPMKEASSAISAQEYNSRFSSTTEWVKYANRFLCDAGFNFYSTNPKRLRLYRDFMNESDEQIMRAGTDGREMGQVEIAYLLRTFSWDYNLLTGRSFDKDKGSVFALMFDERFPSYIDSLAKDVAAVFRDSRNFIGYYTDNELQFRYASSSTQAIYLRQWLKLSSDGGNPVCFDAARAYAEKFIRDNYGVEPLASNITTAMEDAFLKDICEMYYNYAASALRRHDSNHLILGSRLHGKPKSLEIVTAACAKYCDLISVNVYGVWEPNDSYFVSELPKWAPDKPVWVTEFYTRNANETYEGRLYGNTGEGGGWLVKSHRSRGVHYQNFTRKLLSYNYIAGWQWFQLTDDYLEAYGWNNKGLISPKYEYYTDCVDLMRQMHWNIYQVFNYYYDRAAATPSASDVCQTVWSF